MFDKYWVNKSTLEQGYLNSIIGPRAKQFTGANTYTTTHKFFTCSVSVILEGF
jgi:hypothetical protein